MRIIQSHLILPSVYRYVYCCTVCHQPPRLNEL
nr:MAG TPA: Cytochrome c [Caudoviricetes sp.]